MNMNVGRKDRLVRVVIGVFLLMLVVVGPQTPWGYIGLIPLLTGLFGRCALYSLFGIS
ncbi:MAG: DUF2892 domain-containing protein, partial [Gammaproteobacteria bacterium]|nr:DUF2892 domain-containing protein [Gammaproteobacteria bacterium]